VSDNELRQHMAVMGLDLAIYIEDNTGKICITTPEGMVKINPGRDCADVATMLAEHCDNRDHRAFVANAWSSDDD
jgi:hypothetical protein